VQSAANDVGSARALEPFGRPCDFWPCRDALWCLRSGDNPIQVAYPSGAAAYVRRRHDLSLPSRQAAHRHLGEVDHGSMVARYSYSLGNSV